MGELTPGKSVLWHAGASNVSIAGIQLARAMGASAIYATAGSDEKCTFVTAKLGVDAAFNYKKEDWAIHSRRSFPRTRNRVSAPVNVKRLNYQSASNLIFLDGRLNEE